MKLGKCKQALADLINSNGGWVDGANFSSQDCDGWVYHFTTKPTIDSGSEVWKHKGCIGKGHFKAGKIKNWHQTILSREEYYQAYPMTDDDGWIEWKGGECPVDGESIVDVEFNSGNIVSGVAKGLSWRHEWKYSNVIAYRLHKPEVKPELCESVMRCIPEPESHEKLSPEAIDDAKFALMSESIEESKRKPTIEQLAQDYRNKLDFAKRKQQEADEAKVAADVALGKLERAGEAMGLLIGIVRPDPELVITDWRDLRVGDVVECVRANCSPDKFNGMTGEVIAIDYSCDGQPVKVLLGGHEIWCYEVKFISRP